MKKRILCLLLALALLFSLGACSRKKSVTPLKIYYPTPATNDLTAQAISSRDYTGSTAVERLIAYQLSLIFGTRVNLVNWKHTDDLLQVTLSPGFDELSGIDLTLAESCIVLTLCQLSTVSRVQILTHAKTYSIRTAEDMLFTGAEEEPREIPVELYFPRSSGRGLGFESRVLILTEDDDLYSEVTRALLSGPESSGLQAPFPEDLEVLGSRLESGVCHINFSSQLLDVEASAAAKDLLLYSIVDTLGNMDSVNSVQLMVEGEPLLHYGNTDTSMPLEPDFGLLAD